MQIYEKLGVFYLGRSYDLKKRKQRLEPLLYRSNELVTHGLVVGMTGSGKTGLCCGLIEEAAMDGIPSIIIDPKGDLGNLMLTFPKLRAEDFAPWVNEDDALKAGLAPEDFAGRQAELWRQGLASWGQDGERIQRLRDAADFALYTPGSSAGLPVSIIRSFAAPPPEVMEDGELLRDRVSSTVASLLGLVGISPDPVKSRESILLANILQHAWADNCDMDLAGLIQEVQNPSIQRLGVIDMEAFYPAKERFGLAIQLNNLLASPSFASWGQGEPLDIGRFLYSPGGKPRVAILSIAHLGDAERMFFVTLVLNQVLGWMRTQSGTSSLRALVYMDEIFGYFPPVANPPSKQPLLALLKQGRAYGIGVVLATQNPVDLDYKGLSNIGSWFIGRLQTDRDKARVLEGLEGAAAGGNSKFDRAAMEQSLAGLGRRVFLLHNVHEDEPVVFESRWTMSYLRGPLSRSQIKTLAQGLGSSESPRLAPTSAVIKDMPSPEGTPGQRPVLAPDVPQFFAPVTSASPHGGKIVYTPRLLGAARVRYADAKMGVDELQEVTVVTAIGEGALPVDWTAAVELSVNANDLKKEPLEGEFEACSSVATDGRNYALWAKDFQTWIQNHRKLILLRSPSLGKWSGPGESERDFRIRLQQTSREARDAAAEKLRAKYTTKISALQERLRRAEAAKQREASQATRAKVDAVVSFGSTLLRAFLGRKAVSAGTLGKAATTIRSAGRAIGQSEDVERAQDTVEAVKEQLREFEARFQAEISAAAAAPDPAAEVLERAELRPARSDINVRLVGLVWLPRRRNVPDS